MKIKLIQNLNLREIEHIYEDKKKVDGLLLIM
jgi:hypothetical protein